MSIKGYAASSTLAVNLVALDHIAVAESAYES